MPQRNERESFPSTGASEPYLERGSEIQLCSRGSCDRMRRPQEMPVNFTMRDEEDAGGVVHRDLMFRGTLPPQIPPRPATPGAAGEGGVYHGFIGINSRHEKVKRIEDGHESSDEE